MPSRKTSNGEGKHPGSSPSAGGAAPTAGGAKTFPIEHVVVLMLENRSFDHILGFRTGVNGLKGTESNLLDPTQPASTANPAFVVDDKAPFAVLAGEGPGHSLNAASWQLCNDPDGPTAANPGKNTGFVSDYQHELVYGDRVTNPSNEILQVVMSSFSARTLPSIHALADAFCVCDHWYSEVPGPTQPNRLYLHAATSFGYTHNVWTKKFAADTVYSRLQDAGKTWAVYWFDDNDVAEFTQVDHQQQNFKLYEDSFVADVETGILANYTFIEPRFVNSSTAMANSQHAPQDARYGDNLIADVYETLRANDALWKKTALIVIYDEHGGFYDHVVPPAQGVPNPDGINSPPSGDAKWATPFSFDRLGFRVPAVIASPWVKKGTVDSTQYQHTSVIATLAKLFGPWQPLTKRDDSAQSFEQLFLELAAPRTDTPAQLPRATLPTITASPDHPSHPANHPLDQTQKDVLLRAYHVTQSSHPDGPAPDELPTTQAEASAFIRARYQKHFATRAANAKTGKHPPA